MFGLRDVIFWGFYISIVQIFSQSAAQLRPKPNMVFIVADDLGWNDVGYHNDKIKTKNIDMMANNGVILDQSYVQSLCSPSRHAFLTGSYPYHDGLQHLVILPKQRVCTPLSLKLLPQYLKDLGYATHMVGKWHIGFYKWRCTPTFRGFDSFFGFYNAQEGYFDHKLRSYVDLHENTEPVKDKGGIYSTNLFQDKACEVISNHDRSRPLFLYLPFQSVHDPIEVPKEYEDMYPNIQTKGRRKFSGMVTAMDDAIGNITNCLKARGLYDNTLFAFTTDNGGLPSAFGNNYPLRGGKSTIYEGGTRGVAFMHGAGIRQPGRVYRGLMHAVDWVPTLTSAAGAGRGMVRTRDGVDQWEAISRDLRGPRREFVYNWDTFPTFFNTYGEGRKAIRVNNFKLIVGFPGLGTGWYPPDEVTAPENLPEMDFSENNTDWMNHINNYGLSQDNGGLFKETYELYNLRVGFPGLGTGWYPPDEVTAPENLPEMDFSENNTDWMNHINNYGLSQDNGGLFKETYELYNLRVDPNERNDLSVVMPGKVKELKKRLKELTIDAVPPNFPLPDPKLSPIWRGYWSSIKY